eukprot:Blabericola_migrator_1__1531@NODE_1402_length_4619_cov_95_278559_g584_i1_p5_GENE_NODE_1402_length_4619_cov_95_278559_g584_i1NODE_1402_length_4619_cov_95_278559_g584_i1_p5_ORF_typecomplete_len101_score6_32_NODE_1402_length_4619_cov_95_278559_g584_i131513453
MDLKVRNVFIARQKESLWLTGKGCVKPFYYIWKPFVPRLHLPTCHEIAISSPVVDHTGCGLEHGPNRTEKFRSSSSQRTTSITRHFHMVEKLVFLKVRGN